MGEKQVLLTLTQSEALVLFEFLSRFSDHNRLAIEHQAEERILWDLCTTLERELVEPFQPDYGDLLGRARKIVADSKEPKRGHEAG